jgi:hypothetical protein
MDITSWIIFVWFKYIWLVLNLIWSIIMKNLTNIENFEHMKYICDKIIFIAKFEILNIYFKIKVLDGILGRLFYDVWYWCTSIKYRKF